ncbi:MAG: DMT family transporter [Pseudomonadota bacterium]
MTALSDTLPQPSRRAWAMELMVVSSVGISFGGLVIRAIEAADVWQINFYRSIALVVMVAFIMVLRHGCDSFACTRGIGRPGLLGGILSGMANALFIAASKHLVAAELTLFMLLEFALGPVWVWLFIAETPTRATITGGAIVISSVAARAGLELLHTRNRRKCVVQPPL